MCYDVIIIGAGPAGLTAGLYGARAKLKTLLIEKSMPGGRAATTDIIENYPGFPEGINGFELGIKMKEQAEKFGLEIVTDDVTAAELQGEIKTIRTNNSEYRGKAVIIATGARANELEVPGERALTGRGVSYCGTCDGAFFQDQQVVVVGGGDTAIEEALFLTRFASKVTVIHRRDSLRATKILQDRAFAEPKISFIWNSAVERIIGEEKVTGVEVHNLLEDTRETLATDGVFIFVGATPETEFLAQGLKCTEKGYIVADETTVTCMPGVFAAGDVRTKELRQVVTAVADGANAIIAAEKYLEGCGNK
ncbi:MAG: thioredoxin-disulfide reductase [Clostridia bacterium]|nr:thioredoxin-disulfide reductase [Clostridia bacterium]